MSLQAPTHPDLFDGETPLPITAPDPADAQPWLPLGAPSQ